MLSRSFEEIISDNLLYLHLVSHTDDLGRTKLQKLVYLIECKLGHHGINTFNYNFYRWNYGPFTEEIFQDGEALVENNIIHDISTKPTERGSEILCQCEELFDDNNRIIRRIDKLINKYDDYSLPQIIDVVYNSKVLVEDELIRVEDVPRGTELNIKVSPDEAKLKFDINEEWFETLDILFDYQTFVSYEDAVKDAQEGRVSTIIF